ncbi:alpha/beta fold hydrolase [Cohnella suwonensis]|uniref:Alpha/beta fold hydrolase n=1 Tax=Cohnella suwonensis TaxID=696072 RepID=A0ABW0M298_9BACL
MKRKKIWRIVRIAMLYGLALAIVLLAVGYFYQSAGNRNDRSVFKPVGKLVDVFGGKMHVYSGGEGDATVVLSAGWGTVNPYVDFYPLIEKLAGRTRYAVVDNFGYGYSDVTDRKRDIDLIVEEMREGLNQAGQKPPYIMVGHSLASLESIRFAQKYPDEVKGIVLIDGGSPEYYAAHRPLTFISHAQRFLVRFGIARALYHFDGFEESLASDRNGLKLLPEKLKEMDRVSSLLIANNKNITDEMRQSRNNAKKVIEGTKPLAVPLIAMTAGSFGKATTDWLNSQKELPLWSKEGKQILVDDANHYIHLYRPDLVAEAILSLEPTNNP